MHHHELIRRLIIQIRVQKQEISSLQDYDIELEHRLDKERRDGEEEDKQAEHDIWIREDRIERAVKTLDSPMSSDWAKDRALFILRGYR